MINTHQILTLQHTKGVGRKTVQKIIRAFETLNKCLEAENLSDFRSALKEIEPSVSRFRTPSLADLKEGFSRADRIKEQAKKLEINFVGYTHPKFPDRLRVIPDPPVLLYVKGDFECLRRQKSIAVVGTREPSDYGRDFGEQVGAWLAERKIVVVSGLAYGCDAAAHQGCTNEHGQGVAVLAGGLSIVSPKGNRSLANQLLEDGGCLVSEHPPKEKPRRGHFVQRNRIQSGLSDGVVVVETGIKGGTMHTVRFAKSQDRKLACLSHREGVGGYPEAEGNTHLMKNEEAFPLEDEASLDAFLSSVVCARDASNHSDDSADSSNGIPASPTDAEAATRNEGSQTKNPTLFD